MKCGSESLPTYSWLCLHGNFFFDLGAEKKVLFSFALVFALVLCGVVSVHWHRKWQEMSTNSCISDTDSLIAVRFPRQSFTAAHLSVPLGAEFTFVFLYQKIIAQRSLTYKKIHQISWKEHCKAKTNKSLLKHVENIINYTHFCPR